MVQGRFLKNGPFLSQSSFRNRPVIHMGKMSSNLQCRSECRVLKSTHEHPTPPTRPTTLDPLIPPGSSLLPRGVPSCRWKMCACARQLVPTSITRSQRQHSFDDGQRVLPSFAGEQPRVVGRSVRDARHLSLHQLHNQRNREISATEREHFLPSV